MIIEGVAGVLGITSISLSVGATAFLLATFMPAIAGAMGALVFAGGLHTWLTRK